MPDRAVPQHYSKIVRVVLVVVLVTSACRPQVPLRPVVPDDDPASKTAAYLLARGEYLLPGAALLLDYPRRKFDLQWARPIVDAVSAKLTDPNEFSSVGVFARMVDPVAARALQPSITSTIETYREIPTTYALLKGLYCDWSPPPADFASFLTQRRPELKHWRASSLMALAYLEANRCVDDGRLGLLARELSGEYSAFLDEIVASNTAPGAEFVETVGGLYFALGSKFVKAEWASYVIEHQEPDGTWRSGGAPDSGPDDLTAAWGLIAVLEYMHPQAPPVSVIPAGR